MSEPTTDPGRRITREGITKDELTVIAIARVLRISTDEAIRRITEPEKLLVGQGLVQQVVVLCRRELASRHVPASSQVAASSDAVVLPGFPMRGTRFALADAVERLVVTRADPPRFAAADHRPRRVGMTGARGTCLSPTVVCPGELDLQDVGDLDQELRSGQRPRDPVATVSGDGLVWI